jgi:hypothetical protein
MKFFSVFTILAATIVAACASHVETNAARFARGLPPLPPHRRSTPVAGPLSHTSEICYTHSLTVQLPGEALPLEARKVRATLVLFNAATASPGQTILTCPSSPNFWVLLLTRMFWLASELTRSCHRYRHRSKENIASQPKHSGQ